MAVPATPNNVYVQQGNGQVFISFDISAGATSYSILRSTDGITFASIASPVTNSYLDTSAVLNTLYYYQVQAVNASGSSIASVAQSVVPTNSGELTLGQLRLMAQQRADRVGSNFVTVPEWNSYINQSYFELYDLLVSLYDDYYLASPLTFQTDGSASSYAIPNGTNYSGARALYKLWGVDCVLGNSGFTTLKKFDAIDRNNYVFHNLDNPYLGVFNLRYRLVGSNIMFIPTPAAGQSIKLWYIPKLNQLLQDTDTVDGVSGWTEYIIVDAAIKALQKEESDVSVLFAQKQALIERITTAAMNRDVGQADTISNTRKAGSFDDEGFGGGMY